MFTVCPKCTLTLVVTTVDLRAGQGYVRCGRCSNVFNALIALREGDPASGSTDEAAQRRLLETAPKSVDPARGVGVEMDPAPEPEPEPTPEPEPAHEIESPSQDADPLLDAHAEEIVLTGDPDAATVSEDESLEFDAAATDVSEIFISPADGEDDAAPSNYEAVILEIDPPAPGSGDDWSLLDEDQPPADAESVIEESPLTFTGEAAAEPASTDPAWVEQMFAEAEAQAKGPREDAPTAEPADAEPSAAAGSPVAPPLARPPQTAPSDAALAPLLAQPGALRPSWQYVAGLAALVLAFALQVAHHHRQSLAISPTWGPLAGRIYGWFGVTLTPRWDLTAYSVRQLGADAEDADGTRLRVRVSLHNESARVQPLPLLRLTLSDRFGNPVATRDLEPVDYLPRSLAGERLLKPDQRIDAEVHVRDPGKTAMGFVIDACLRASNGNIGCTADARALAQKRAAG